MKMFATFVAFLWWCGVYHRGGEPLIQGAGWHAETDCELGAEPGSRGFGLRLAAGYLCRLRCRDRVAGLGEGRADRLGVCPVQQLRLRPRGDMDAVAAAVQYLRQEVEIGRIGRMGLMGSVSLAAPLLTRKFNQ